MLNQPKSAMQRIHMDTTTATLAKTGGMFLGCTSRDVLCALCRPQVDKHASPCMQDAASPDENSVMSTVLTSKDFLKTRQVMAERSWQDSCPI